VRSGRSFLHAVANLQKGHTSAGILAIAGLAGALWSASGYVAAFMRASNAIYDVPEGRPLWKTTPIRIGVTLVIMIMIMLCAVMVVVTGGLARQVGQTLGIGSVAITVWDIAKWPVLLIIVSLMFAILYWVSPNAKRGLRWVSPGGVVAVVGWLVASGLFALYVANFGHYNKTYGSVAAVIIFLVWLWITNLVILVGAEFNAELERGRAGRGGRPARARALRQASRPAQAPEEEAELTGTADVTVPWNQPWPAVPRPRGARPSRPARRPHPPHRTRRAHPGPPGGLGPPRRRCRAGQPRTGCPAP
jgi:YihY family inner membrane protein